MKGINENLPFIPIRIAILTISDSRALKSDTSGQLLCDRVEAGGHVLADRKLVSDDVSQIRNVVQTWINDPEIDIVVSTGGTGLAKRDVTPEALRPLFEKELDGFSVIFHQVSFESVGLSTLQSRALAGLANDTFIFALPGSNGAVKDGWDKVIQFQLDSRHKPCNLVELLPRYSAQTGHG